jgi:hypothetical protein
VPYLILNQYRNGSSYKDEVGTLYHFPKRYLKRIETPEASFIYYEPRVGGEQAYFGSGTIGQIWPDPEDATHYYSEILDYSPFPKTVSYWGLRGKAFEPARTMRNSVRSIDKTVFDGILKGAGFGDELQLVLSPQPSNFAGFYETAKPELRRFLAARYERPNRITKFLKERLGPTCQICGLEGFLMRNGKRYCEVHHLFHLAKRLPGSLSPSQLIIVCPTCHRKLYYAPTTDPVEADGIWSFELCGRQVSIPVFKSGEGTEGLILSRNVDAPELGRS